MDGQLVQDFKNYSNSFGIGFLKEYVRQEEEKA